MATVVIERRTLRLAVLAVPLSLVLLLGYLFVRLLPDVAGKPLHEDEAVAGLISARPLGELLQTVVLDRGGAPLHFLLAHFTLRLDASPEALRWLSVVFALATIPVCYDFVHRLAGPLAGLTAAALAATSQLLAIYGSFGRMYSLFAFVATLALDLFVRAVQEGTRSAAVVATAAVLLPLFVHPFGAFLFVSEVAVAAFVWRGKNLRWTIPVVGLAALSLPLLLSDLRLADRYRPEAGSDLDGGYSALEAAVRGLGGAAGGYGVVFVLFAVLAIVGLAELARRQRPLAALAVIVIAMPPVVLTVAAAANVSADRLAPRHLIFTLPAWLALVAVGLARVGQIPRKARLVLPIAAVVAAALAPPAVSEPRTQSTGEQQSLEPAATWLRQRVTPGDALYPYSALFLAALPDTADARGYSREPVALKRALARTGDLRNVWVSLPLPDGIAPETVRGLRRAGIDTHDFNSWLVLRDRGLFRSGREALGSAARMLERAGPVLAGTPLAHSYLLQLRGTACRALNSC